MFPAGVPSWFWWTYFTAAIIGHFGLYVALYNRLNALGFRRRRIKQLEWLLLLLCLLTPLLLAWQHGEFLHAVLFDSPAWQAFPMGLYAYTLLCLAMWIYPGIRWLWTRPLFGYQRVRLDKTVRYVHVEHATEQPLALTTKCRLQSRWPLNQILHLAVEEKQLPVPGLPRELDGFKIAHFSDVHLTGHIAVDYFRYAVDQANVWQPDLVALTGDIVDYDRCIEWLEPCFGHALASQGCYFVLGNHDTRVRDPRDIRREMERIGWQDVGSRWLQRRFAGCDVHIVGNEAPWFPAPAPLQQAASRDFALALCHSPDRIDWARQSGIELMLAGHTHGGQGRLPLAGPLLSPSCYGSRFASGEFFLSPTTLHVSRGISGVHLLRINCPPELALLVLRCAD